jgi:hypothetical protein
MIQENSNQGFYCHAGKVDLTSKLARWLNGWIERFRGAQASENGPSQHPV